MNKKRILLVTQNFYPENFKSNDIAFELIKRGYDVDALVSIPNYPKGKFFDGYGILKKRIETISGVRVYRAFLVPRGKGGSLMLVLNYLSFAFFASFWALWLGLFKKYDSVIVQQTSPITQALPAIIVKKLQHIPLYLWVLDLWPESLTATSNIKNRYIIKCVENLVKYVYKSSYKILISSNRFRESILSKGKFENKLIYFPNWAEDVFSNKTDFKLPELPNGFKIMWAGNIGEAQGFDSIMDVALLLKNYEKIKWIIVGDGRKREWVEQFIKKNELEKTVFMMGKYDIEAMPSFFKIADVMLVSLKNSLISDLTLPAKVQAYMSASKPIIAMLNGEGQYVIKSANCGYVVNSGDTHLLSKVILDMSKMTKEELMIMGNNGQIFYQKHFNKNLCMNNLCDIIENKL